MAEEDELPQCSTLFLTEDGSQMRFYMTPCTMKTRLRPLIYHGGGVLSSKVHPDSIKLVAPGTGSNISGYVSTDYILDSIKHNKLQDMDKYRLKSADSTSVKSSTSEKKSVTSSTIKVPSRGRKNGRHQYTPAEDLALMDFVNKNRSCYTIKGNLLYKRAERKKVTSHPWQSMRDHYIKVLHKPTTSAFTPLLVQTTKLKSSAGVKKDTEHRKGAKNTSPSVMNREQARMTRTQATIMKDKIESKSKLRAVTPDTDEYMYTEQGRMTRAQASKVKEKVDSANKHAATAGADDCAGTDQRKMTRAQASKVKEKLDSPNKHTATADAHDCVGTDQRKTTRAQASKVKEKLDSPNKHAVTLADADDCAGNDQGKMTKTQAKVKEKMDSKIVTDDCADTDNVPDDASADNADNESSASDVDYDKIFDDNLLKQAYECKEKDGNEIDMDSTDDEGVAEENRISSSQETAKRGKTRHKMLTNEQEKMSDFEGEVVYKDNLKSSSAKKVHSDEDKRPIAKRSRMDLESSPDHANAAAKEKKDGALAFFNYYQALQTCIQRNSDLTVPQFIHGLLVNSGYLDDAENHVKNGKEQWALQEDKILLSKNKEEISSLAKKRGLNAVVDRMNFIDGIN